MLKTRGMHSGYSALPLTQIAPYCQKGLKTCEGTAIILHGSLLHLPIRQYNFKTFPCVPEHVRIPTSRVGKPCHQLADTVTVSLDIRETPSISRGLAVISLAYNMVLAPLLAFNLFPKHLVGQTASVCCVPF